jgi:hypothetical protein
MSQDNKLQIASSGIEQLLLEVKKQIAVVSDAEKQLQDTSTIITNFTLQTLQAVQGNEDIPTVNETLANSLVQIKDFLSKRPVYIREELSRLMSKLDAYEQSMLILSEVETLPDVEEAEPEPTVSKSTTKKSTKKQSSALRKISERPERLKNIRQAEEKNEDAKISQEDI